MPDNLTTTKLVRPNPRVAYVVLQEEFNSQLDLDALKDVVEQAYRPHIQNNEKFIMVFNTEHTISASPFLVKEFAEWMNSKREISSRLLHCSIMIITSTFTRACFNAILMLFTPSRPFIVSDSVDAANKELRHQLNHI